jgi:hypothetical protein
MKKTKRKTMTKPPNPNPPANIGSGVTPFKWLFENAKKVGN